MKREEKKESLTLKRENGELEKVNLKNYIIVFQDEDGNFGKVAQLSVKTKELVKIYGMLRKQIEELDEKVPDLNAKYAFLDIFGFFEHTREEYVFEVKKDDENGDSLFE